MNSVSRAAVVRRLGLLLLVAGAAAASLGPFTAATARGTSFPAQHFQLAPVNGEPLANGFVEVIHPNGPEVYARHEYHLNGADANRSFDVVISIWTSNLTCSGPPAVVIPAAVLVTNASGSGNASVGFTPEMLEALGLRGLTIGGQVTLLWRQSTAYTTGCKAIQLD
jgi:hypothetical protein